MAEFIVMPKLGFDMREGVLVGWLKQIGDSIAKGDVVAEIESDKATLELEAQVAGILLQTLAEAGAVVPVGANLAIVGSTGEDVSGLVSAEPKGAAETVAAKTAAAETAAAAEPAPAAAPAALSASVSDEFPGGVKASPVARRIAAEQNVDLRQISGSGPDGRIRKRDVETYLQAAPAAKPAAQPISPPPVPAGPETTEVPLTRLRQAIARRMTESKTTVPHFYVTTEVDMQAALDLRKQINALLPEDGKITVNDMIVKAAAVALRDFPNLNASFNGTTLVRHNRINVGSAVAVAGGLLTVVQKNTNLTPLAQVAAENKVMIARARSGKISPDDVTGGTFTVSNLGGYDVDHFIAIINPPEAAILAIGTARQVPVVVDGQLTIGFRMKATLSADHRVTDGVEAAQYLQRFKAIMEAPLQLLL